MILRSAAEILEEAGIHRPRWTAEQLLAHRLGCEPLELYLEPPAMDCEEELGFQADVAARANGVPLQYLVGSAGFYGREFRVGPGVFIPRPETEILVEVALEYLRNESVVRPEQAVHPSIGLRMNGASKDGSLIVLDVGTGSGAIAITLALERPGLEVMATDLSSPALSFASGNALRHQARVRFLQGDLLASFAAESADLIVANLPYLDPAKVLSWPRELYWEPWLAQDGGPKGLSLIERLLDQGISVLKPKGRIILEMGDDQAESIRTPADKRGFQVERVVPDLAGRDRVLVLKREGMKP